MSFSNFIEYNAANTKSSIVNVSIFTSPFSRPVKSVFYSYIYYYHSNILKIKNKFYWFNCRVLAGKSMVSLS